MRQSLASLQSPLNPVIDRLPVLHPFRLCATNGDGLYQLARNRLAKRQRKCALASEQSNQGVIEVLVELRIGWQLYRFGHKGSPRFFQLLESVTRLAQRCKQWVVQGQVSHARAKSLGPSGLARCHAAKGLLA